MASLFKYNPNDPASHAAAREKAIKSMRSRLQAEPVSETDVQLPENVQLEQKDPVTGIGPDALPAEAIQAPDANAPALPTPAGQADQKLFNKYREALKSPQVDLGKIQSIQDRMDNFLAPGNNPEYTKASAEVRRLSDELNSLHAEKKDEVSRNEFMQVAEQLGNALLQLGAGAYGLKHGVDVSGTKFSKGDWEARLANRLGLLNDRIKDLRSGQMQLTQEQAQTRREAAEQARAGFQADVGAAKEQARMESDTNRQAIMMMIQDARQAKAEKAAEQKQSQELLKLNTTEALKNQAELIKKSEMEEQGLQQAIQIMQDSSIKASDKEKLLDKALGKTTVMPGDIESQEKPLWQIWGESNDTLKSQYLQSRLKQAQEQTRQLRQDRLNMTGAKSSTPVATPTPTAPAATGDVKMRLPSGTERMIPAANVEAAKAKGAVVIQ